MNKLLLFCRRFKSRGFYGVTAAHFYLHIGWFGVAKNASSSGKRISIVESICDFCIAACFGFVLHPENKN
jgi:hypothetical protein